MNREVQNPPASPAAVNAIDEFRAGVTAVLRSWSPLRAAIESGWGGIESNAKGEDLRNEIYRVFDGSCFPPKMDISELEDELFDYMEQQFSVVLEDESEKQVAEVVYRMYEGCHKGDVSLARQMVVLANKAEEASKAYPVQVQSNPDDEIDEDDDKSNNAMQNIQQMGTAAVAQIPSFTAQQYASGSLFGVDQQTKPTGPAKPTRQLGESEPEKPAPEVDDDGFTSVVPNRRRK
mmetsp:Transcript_997/g.1578  ORF Transcript_997/g.1578 Transcript_997/m.1578 type:complete len:234 (+) Transcript_997:83-784(+)